MRKVKREGRRRLHTEGRELQIAASLLRVLFQI
jgi:hypothetical protein